MQLVLIESDFINYYYLTEDGIVDCVNLFFLSLKICRTKKSTPLNSKLAMSELKFVINLQQIQYIVLLKAHERLKQYLT